MTIIFTIGHSNHPVTRFLEMLADAEIQAVADVRSQPVSRWAPQFNKEALISTLEACGLAYYFKGRELGGRPASPALLKAGKPDYAKMAETKPFLEGVTELLKEAAEQRIAIMCAERDPVNCHRFLLIGRHLSSRGVEVAHILADGAVEAHAETEQRLLATKPQAELFG